MVDRVRLVEAVLLLLCVSFAHLLPVVVVHLVEFAAAACLLFAHLQGSWCLNVDAFVFLYADGGEGFLWAIFE